MKTTNPYHELEASMFAALETYSNVHRGSGHFSKATTHLYEKARIIVLDFLGLSNRKYRVMFFTPRRADAFIKTLTPGSFVSQQSRDFGLNLGVAAIAVRKKALPAGIPFETGGGTTKLYGTDWVMWAKAPDKFEAGTPPILNVIGFAKALLMIKQHGKDIFREETQQRHSIRQILHEDELARHRGKELLYELRKTLTGRDVRVPTTKGLQHFVNFDNSASTPGFGPVWNAFTRVYRQPEQFRQEIIGEVKRICAETMGAPLKDYEIFFTSNTTESINIVAQGLGNEPISETLRNDDIEPVILTTILEHSSNDLPWRQVAGHTVIRLAVGKTGFFRPDELESLLKSYNKEHLHGRKRIRLLAISGASNVLGSCNDLSGIGRLAKQYGARLLADAAQLAAHRKIDMEASGIDYLAFSAHKVYAPFGTGVLIARKGLLKIHHNERALINASALENAGGIAALGKALLLLNRIGFDCIEKEETRLTGKALQAMSQIPGLKLHGAFPVDLHPSVSRIGVITFEIGNKMPARIAARLARHGGTGVRFGCHCAHLIIKQLAEFTPFGEKLQRFILRIVPMLNLQGVTRVSLGIQNTDADVDALISELKRIARVTGNQTGNKNEDETGKGIGAVSDNDVKQQMKDFIKSRERMVYG